MLPHLPNHLKEKFEDLFEGDCVSEFLHVFVLEVELVQEELGLDFGPAGDLG